MKKERMYMLDILKIAAILLVFNSHCDNLYNNSIYATGGALGNALFFIVCGYLIKIDGNFFAWFMKKIKRLYIPMLIVTIISCIVLKSIPITIFEIIKVFIWPTNYWFIGALIIFYILLYILEKYNIIKNIKFFTIIMMTIYFLYYFLLMDTNIWSIETPGLLSISGIFKLIYYFYIFVLGYYIKNHNFKNQKNSIIVLFIIIIILFSYFGFKLLLYRNLITMTWQFIVQIIGILFAIMCLIFSINFENTCRQTVNKKILNNVVNLSNISLEIYLCQFIVIKLSENIIFPLNIIIALIFTIISSAIVYRIVSIITAKKQEVSL